MNGKITEDLVIAQLLQKCDIKRENAFDHIYKLDFIIDRFKSIHKMIPLGVQITTRLNDVPKMREFVSVRKKRTMVDKSIYIEIHPEVDLDAWGSELLYSSLISFVFEKENKEKLICGVRINPDISYEYFDIENVSSLSKGSVISGLLTFYRRDKGFGFISAGGETYFYHVSNIDDPELKTVLISEGDIDHRGTLNTPIEVLFEDAGYDNDQRKYRKAVNVLK